VKIDSPVKFGEKSTLKALFSVFVEPDGLIYESIYRAIVDQLLNKIDVCFLKLIDH
jgi:hypothetical protein